MAENNKNQVFVWDALVRVFHWSLATFFLLAYFFIFDRLKLHAHIGYSVALLIIFRLLWGVIGSHYARFKEFVTSPRETLSYLMNMGRAAKERAAKERSGSTTPHYLGHNPAGAAMIIALLLLIFCTALSGIILYAIEGSGPLSGTLVANWPGGVIVEIHEWSADLSLALVVLHVLGVLYSSYIDKENLVKAMFTGRKHNPETLAARETETH